MGRRRPPAAEEGTQCQASDLRFVRTEDVVLADSGDTDRSWCEADLAHNNDALAEGTWIGIDAGGAPSPTFTDRTTADDAVARRRLSCGER
jgi:hypothetical protein